MDTLRYEAIAPMSREDVEAALLRDEPDDLARVVVSVALHADDEAWASNLCVRLATHHHFNVRGNAILGFGHLARRYRNLAPAARQIIEAGLRDSDAYVRGQASDAADDAEPFLGWTLVRPMV